MERAWLLVGLILLSQWPKAHGAATPGEYFSNANLTVFQMSFGPLAPLGTQEIEIAVMGNKMRWTTGDSLMFTLVNLAGGSTGVLPKGPHTSIYNGDQPDDKKLTYLVNNQPAQDSVSRESGSVYTQGSKPFGYGGPLFGMIMEWGQMIYVGSSVENDGTFWHPKVRWHHRYAFFGYDPVDVGLLICEASLFTPWDIWPVSYFSTTTSTYYVFTSASHGSAQASDFQPPPGSQPLVARTGPDGQPFGANVEPGS
ncbi:MAG: hypothetical protein SNJ84_08710, partial [Verrucomicrobiia bacterium]